MGFFEVKERKLRDNYQINKDGIPKRLPELPGMFSSADAAMEYLAWYDTIKTV
jgi:hypothetical protein